MAAQSTTPLLKVEGLKQYFRQEQYVKEMFVITEED